MEQLAEMKKKRIDIEDYLNAQANYMHHEEAVEKIYDFLENVDRREMEKGKSHVIKLIKRDRKLMFVDDELDNIDLDGVIDNYYTDHGLDSEGKERTD